MDECAARIQPLVDQYKNPDNTKLSQLKKFRDLIVTTLSCPVDKKISFLELKSKIVPFVHKILLVQMNIF